MKKSQLQQIIREEIQKALNESIDLNDARELGFNTGPSKREEIAVNSAVAGYVKAIANLYNEGRYPLSELEKNETIKAFIEGYVKSYNSEKIQNTGLPITVAVLKSLAKNGWPKGKNYLKPDLK